MKNNKSYRSFQEYLTHKGKVLTKPPVEDTPDYKGPKPKTPAKATTKGKGWEVPNVGKKGTPGAYKSGTDKAPKKAEKGGFADMGDKSLVYEPADEIHGGKGSVSKSEQGVPGGSKSKSWPKGGSTTEAFLNATKGMSTSQFAKHIKKGLNEHCGCEDKKAPHVVAYSVGAFHPDPIQAIRYVTYLANENTHLRTALIREARRAGCAAELMHELLQLPESYTALARIIDGDKGESFSRRLDKAIRENRDAYRKKAKLHEEVDEPAHDDDVDVNDLDKSELEDGDGDDLDLDSEEGDDLDLDGDSEDDDLDLGDEDGDDLGDGDKPDLDGMPDLDGGDAAPDLAGGDGPPDLDGGDLEGDPHANTPPPSPDDLGDEDGPPLPPPDEGGDDDGKIDFGGDDDDLGDDDLGDDDDLDDDDDLGDDDDDLDDDDLDDDHPKKKMPWEDED